MQSSSVRAARRNRAGITNPLFAALLAALFAMAALFTVTTARADDFDKTLRMAEGQTVYFNAWGGDDKINAYIAWAGAQLKNRYGITLRHVKLNDTAAAVSRILSEKAAGRRTGGSVDLLWVNGENFAAMKRNDLLQREAWVQKLPSWRYTDSRELPAIELDFGEPTEGRESPWGRAQLVFAYDSAVTPNPPRSARELLAYVKRNPGRFSYPQPPDFFGATFLKQILLETTPNTAPLYRPVEEANFNRVTAPLWAWLDEATPYLWRRGKAYPAKLRPLLGDGELDIVFAFNPADASSAIESGELPDTVRTYIHDSGTLANVHFLAIPFNANAPDAARVVANFMLSPEAQIRKADVRVWGDPTVLSAKRLSYSDRSRLEGLPRGKATLTDAELSRTLAEPHPSWVKALEEEWKRRYGSGQ